MTRTSQDQAPGATLSAAHAEAAIDLSIVIVNWNVRELLRRCLASIAGSDALFVEGTQPPAQNAGGTERRWLAEVIVVDNASNDDSVSMLAGAFPWVHVIANRQNLGFTKANNQGLAASSGRYVLFLNPDTEATPQAFSRMLAYAEAHPDVSRPTAPCDASGG